MAYISPAYLTTRQLVSCTQSLSVSETVPCGMPTRQSHVSHNRLLPRFGDQAQLASAGCPPRVMVTGSEQMNASSGSSSTRAASSGRSCSMRHFARAHMAHMPVRQFCAGRTRMAVLRQGTAQSQSAHARLPVHMRQWLDVLHCAQSSEAMWAGCHASRSRLFQYRQVCVHDCARLAVSCRVLSPYPVHDLPQMCSGITGLRPKGSMCHDEIPAPGPGRPGRHMCSLHLVLQGRDTDTL